MLSSHHGKTASPLSSPTCTDTTQPYYNGDRQDCLTGNVDDLRTKSIIDESSDAMDVSYDIIALQHPASPLKSAQKTVSSYQSSSRKYSPNIGSEMTATKFAENASGAVVEGTIAHDNMMMMGDSPSAKRPQLRDLFIATDVNSDQDALANATSPLPQYHPSTPSAHSQHHHHAKSMASLGSQQDYIRANTPPANCGPPSLTLSRRSSLANVLMSPPPSAGLLKSATTNSFHSFGDYSLGDGSKPGTPKQGHYDLDSPRLLTQQERRSSLSGTSRRQSFPSGNPQNTPANLALQRLAINGVAFGAHASANDGSYLPTPTETSFQSSINGESNVGRQEFADLMSLPPKFPPTPSDSFLPSAIHPFDIPPALAVPDTWATGVGGGMQMPMKVSAATTSATIQYLQQLQQSMMQQFDRHGFPHLGHHTPSVRDQTPHLPRSSVQPKQNKAAPLSGTGLQTKKGSKSKSKRRVGNLPVQLGQAPIGWPQSYLPPPDYAMMCDQQMASAFQQSQSQLSGSESSVGVGYSASTASQQQRAFYHGPAPCGNSEPLYEYLASPTIVPGLEIIGHDFYGNYVQILPICPETTCSMNQDPVYLNLLQAIYAHTIPFLDLAPGSEEESQLLKNGTPSAITTQSIQPPFKNLLPLSNPSLNQSKTIRTRGAIPGHPTLTSSASAPSIQQAASKGSSLQRRASLCSISSVTGLNSRRSSVVSNASANNPARKKKNQPRTHPYKSTSSFKEDNPMVTEAILTQVGGLGGIGSSATISATDPRHKVAEKMVHMNEAEYAAHYSKHEQLMNKSTSATTFCLAQTLAGSMMASSQSLLHPSSLMSSSVSAPSITYAAVDKADAPLEATDFIKALSECNGSMSGLGLGSNGSTAISTTNTSSFREHDLISLENLVMMDSAAAAAVQAAAATAWPNWFDLNRLEKDVCEVGMGHQSSAFSSATCSMNNMPLSNSTTLASFANGSNKNQNTNLLLSSSTDLAMMDDLLDDASGNQNHDSSCRDSDMSLAIPGLSADHGNSTSQVLVFDEFTMQSDLLDSPSENSASKSASSPSLSTSISSFSNTSTSIASDKGHRQEDEHTTPVTNDLAKPYISSLLTVLPFSAEHSHPIFPTRGNRRCGWYRSKSVASQGLSQITGVDYTTTCWYDVEQLQNVVRDSISFQESSRLKSLEDLTDPIPPR
ncbi:hypothetical protein BG011_001792 [Mortierella polycephala]|uniref:Uncharacterized protein n=1 Tax=Mortierella polycephala TaxID=41804 RepID=A0A9P6QIY8_9FUNG|nr:hypothetical protein BG011_001792 [Mortierella polycephala]